MPGFCRKLHLDLARPRVSANYVTANLVSPASLNSQCLDNFWTHKFKRARCLALPRSFPPFWISPIPSKNSLKARFYTVRGVDFFELKHRWYHPKAPCYLRTEQKRSPHYFPGGNGATRVVYNSCCHGNRLKSAPFFEPKTQLTNFKSWCCYQDLFCCTGRVHRIDPRLLVLSLMQLLSFQSFFWTK